LNVFQIMLLSSSRVLCLKKAVGHKKISVNKKKIT